MVTSVASGPSFSSTGRVKVPTPGPYSTKTRVFAQSTGSSILSIKTRLDGMTEPTITGFFRKPRRNCQRGLGERRSRRARRFGPLIVRAEEGGMNAPTGQGRRGALANAPRLCKVRTHYRPLHLPQFCEALQFRDEEVSLTGTRP